MMLSACWLLGPLLLHISSGEIYVGRALNILNYFGDLGIVVRVSPQHSVNWFTNNDSVDVFEQVHETRSPVVSSEDAVFNGDFHLELCDNLAQLKQVLFKHYKIEGVERTWRAFTGSWSKSVASRHLGINASFLTGDHGYVLVRLTRHYQMVNLTPSTALRVNNFTTKLLNQLVPGNVDSVLAFIQQSGSHYVSSYTTGDSLYQVFVFTPGVYSELQKQMGAYNAGSLALDQVLTMFTPWHIEHLGRIQSTSGNITLENWAERRLQSRIFMYIYSSLLNIHSTPELLGTLNYLLGDDALSSVELKSLALLFSNQNQRRWFEEVLSNQMNLWELNV